MEIQDSRESYRPIRRYNSAWLIGIIFIVVGLLWFGHNAGVVSSTLFHIVVSWQMLLIVLGISMLFQRRKIVGGAILIGIGGFFMFDKFTDLITWDSWPLVFVLVGVVIIVSLIGTRICRSKGHACR